jgi:hypothetical protein
MTIMWPQFVNLLSHSWDSFLHAMGTTGLGFFGPLVVFVLTISAALGVIAWAQGKDAMKQHWKQTAAITTDVTICVMLVVEQEQYRSSITRFAHWMGDCNRRLEQMKNSIQ